MKNTDEIRKLLKATETSIDGAVEWAKYPDTVWENCQAALDTLRQIRSLLPCETCNGTDKLPRKNGEHCPLRICKNIKASCGTCSCYIPSEPCPDCKEKT